MLEMFKKVFNTSSAMSKKVFAVARNAINNAKKRAENEDYIFITLCAVLIIAALLAISIVLPSLLDFMDVVIVALIAILGAVFAVMTVTYFPSPHTNFPALP